MRAVILAGGEGTRLRPYTTVLPKPLVPVGNRPILELIIRRLAACGFDRIDLSVGRSGDLIKAYFDQTADELGDVEIAYHWESEPLGTAGALHGVDALDEPFLVMNGDILTSLDYGELMRSHRDSEAVLTIAAKNQTVQISLGVIEGEDGVVSGYVEKPALQYEVSMGIYIYEPSVLEHIPRRRFDFPDVVLALIAAGEKVRAYRYDGPWFDIGTPDQHEMASTAFEDDPGLFDVE